MSSKITEMKKFITINGTSAFVSEHDSIEEAIASAQNVCDHSKEILVREIESCRDHTSFIKISQCLLW